MFRKLSPAVSAVALVLATGLLAACGQSAAPGSPLAIRASVRTDVKAQAQAIKQNRAQAEQRAQSLIAAFKATNHRSIDARAALVNKIAATDANAAYSFLLAETEDVQNLRGEIKNLTRGDQEYYEEVLMGRLNDMTPDQAEVTQRLAKAQAMGLDPDELTVVEAQSAGSMGAKGLFNGGGAHIGQSNRLLTAIEQSKLWQAAAKAVRNTRHAVHSFIDWIKAKLHWPWFHHDAPSPAPSAAGGNG